MAISMRSHFLFKNPNYWKSAVLLLSMALWSPQIPVVMLFHLHCCCILWDAPRKDWEQGAPLVDAWAWFLPVFLWLSFLLSGYRGKMEWLFQEFPEGRKKQAGKVNGSFVFSTFLGAWSWCHLLSCYSLCSRKQELLWIFSVPLAIFLL